MKFIFFTKKVNLFSSFILFLSYLRGVWKAAFALFIFLVISQISFGQSLDSLSRIKNYQKKITISGIIRDNSSGETLPYASVGIEGANLSTLSNQYGFYSITLPNGKYKIVYRCIGYEENVIDIVLDKDNRSDIELHIKSQELQEVVITEKNNDLNDIDKKISKIDIATVKKLPSFGGIPDIMRSIQLLPGVISSSEVGGGIQVRGGAWDQNLMLLDEAIVYNATHLEGLYSTFNPDIIKDINFYKSGFPASYGGRLSSVMDITQKDGNMKSYHGEAGIGLISANLSLEGPIVRDKSSFIVAARRSYVDLFFRYFPQIKDVKTFFYDLNSKVNYIINNNNRIYLSVYSGQDVTNVDSYDEAYGNLTGTLRFNHIFNQKLFSNTSLIYSKYKMTDSESANPYAWKNNLGLDHYEFKEHFMFFTAKHKMEFGLKGIFYVFHPGELSPMGDSSQILKIAIPNQYAIEPSVYFTDNYQVSSKISVQYGLRFSDFSYLGPADVYIYSNDAPKRVNTIIDTITYKRNKVIKSYNNLEPRFSIKYCLNQNHSFKLSYDRMAQYIHQISNTIVPLPYDMWKPSGYYIKPLTSHQFSLGYFAALFQHTIDFSFELYYKRLQNVTEVKPGADISLDKTLDADLLQGRGRAYGLEIMVNKTKGKLTGMISYGWSRSEKKIDGTFQPEKINFGRWYSAAYDIPHKISFSGEYKVNERFSFTAVFNYMTGKPITLPSGQYIYFNTLIPYYSGVNLQRLPDYHRLDIAAVWHGKKKALRKWQGFWTFSIYNVYGRENAYTIYIQRKPESQDTEAMELWMLSVVPSLSYTIKF